MSPTAAPARFPYVEHRTLADVDFDEADECEAGVLQFRMKRCSERLVNAIAKARAA